MHDIASSELLARSCLDDILDCDRTYWSRFLAAFIVFITLGPEAQAALFCAYPHL